MSEAAKPESRRWRLVVEFGIGIMWFLFSIPSGEPFLTDKGLLHDSVQFISVFSFFAATTEVTLNIILDRFRKKKRYWSVRSFTDKYIIWPFLVWVLASFSCLAFMLVRGALEILTGIPTKWPA